ncbi:SixA phosphatase family protein [Nocardioides caeni]|uniref:Histidine phosphatase family protein n=1 Tax=Nocardioides caeni TaxID=574700 RepID=A0A4S8NE35_9ACTN|nr:histidine phosphatase family protein [Nocardioides caeni]THV13194.1 histidine phosphatase family protein [Nocardioides caeni]
MQTTRRLVLLRHAQAESFAASDAERPLTDRGRADAAELGRWLAASGLVADEAWVSDATRTRQTWAELAATASWAVAPHYDGSLYVTDEEGVLEILRATADEVTTTVVVGHNPTIGMLTQLLDDGDGAPEDGPEGGSFPTATAAVFEIAGEWAELGPMSGRLTHFHVARG